MLSDRTEAAHHSAAAPSVRHMSAGSERAYAFAARSAFATPSTASGNFSRGSTASFSGSAVGSGRSTAEAAEGEKKRKKPLFRPASDDTKPVLRDPISRSDPVETEQSVLRLPPFP